ncbi:MAG: hypoxanthine-guanine phosphoribosyltransferase [Pseudomonadales bacterium]|nr:hypoxanthine-guanine phosphoribosyltransferase [Pseudomonadales bacterium]MCP5331632.1 hypoxanthine-guanine phosphoribosyltransferase [Pseudomonadales bacterium]MCP5344737.1 hypoxanthine-guanine phosphoribosyltransferase [Pseudomonadales bacterium]
MIAEVQQVLAQADCLYDRNRVQQAIAELAQQITHTLADSNPLVLCVMNGALVFAGELLPQLAFPLQVDYLHASRYREKLAGADLQWKAYPSIALVGRVVLLLDDILDEGDTLVQIREYCLAQQAASVLCAVLVDKRHERRHPDLPRADFTGLEAPDRYLFGYGMDYKGYLRNAPGIYALAGS